MASMAIQPPAVHQILGPVLTSIPAAAFSTQPAAGVLPLLSPILRQRVQLFSSSSHEPWLRLLCYDAEKSPKLSEIARSGSLEPHPVSGEVEVDWELDVETRYRRLDKETLQALVALQTLDLVFQLVYCVGDHGGDGWRIGEVSTADKPSPFTSWGSSRSISEAETEFKNKEEEEEKKKKKVASTTNGLTSNDWHSTSVPGEDDDDDDDDYWARYDATPARTPAMKQSPVPASMKQPTHLSGPRSSDSAEDAYYAQYNTVQPAMDNYDPDEAAAAEQHGITQAVPTAVPPPLGLAKVLSASSSDEPRSADAEETSKVWTMVEKETHGSISSNEDRIVDLVHPRPASSASSNGSQMVAKLEESAGKQEQSEFGVKQHVSRSIRSLFMLSQASGIDREEFERLVKTELDLLGMAEDEI